MKNSFGHLFRVTTFGESHGPGLGAVIDGCPAGVPFDQDLLNRNLARRRPGDFAGASAAIVSQRREADRPEVLSGVFEQRTLGTPIALLVRNTDARSQDYKEIAKKPRVGHADDVWKAKFGHVDPRGGGRSSGRETVARVLAGAVAEMYLHHVLPDLKITAFTTQVGPVQLQSAPETLEREHIDGFSARFPHPIQAQEVKELLLAAKEQGQSYGGTVQLVISGAPIGLGQPVFHKLKADLAAALLGIGATAALDIGAGATASTAEGTEFHQPHSMVYGGLRGGISTGEKITLNVSFKPTSTVLDLAQQGRHDPCIVPRAVPVVEAMAALVLAEHVMWRALDQV